MGLAKLGEVLTQVDRAVEVEPAQNYPMLGVRSFSRGAFDAGQLQGADTAYTRLRRVKRGDVVYPKLMAWEQAFAVVSGDLDGRHVSPEFCTFEVDQQRASTRYIAHLLAWPEFLRSLSAGSTGTNVRRRRLQPSVFLAAKFPLPDLDVQRSIAARLDALMALGGPICESVERIRVLAASVRSSVFSQPTEDLAPLSQVLANKARPIAVKPSDLYRTAGVRWYGEGVFERPPLLGSDIKAKTLFGLESGDLVYNRLFAWKGSFALVEDSHAGLVVSNEFPVFEVDTSAVHPVYLREWLAWPPTWAVAEVLSSGGTPTSRNRLKAELFLDMSVPLPRLDVQWRLVKTLSRVKDLIAQASSRSALATALPQAARNELFSKLV